MRAGHASRTAGHMAFFRALESARPADRRLFADPLARAFLDLPLRLVVGAARMPGVAAIICRFVDLRWPGARTSAVARTRFIDERVRRALATGIDQVVLLGAGYDARAYRLIEGGPVVFEVDHPDTLARKRVVVAATLGALPLHVRYVLTDFNAGQLPAVMQAAGFDPARRALVVWEGVTNYLTEAGVDETLRWCGETAPGSRLVFTYVHRAVLDDPGAFAGTRRLFATLDAAGEGWTFGLDPAQLAAYLAARGLTLDEDVGAAEYRRRCFGRASHAMRGYEFYRIARAHVAEEAG